VFIDWRCKAGMPPVELRRACSSSLGPGIRITISAIRSASCSYISPGWLIANFAWIFTGQVWHAPPNGQRAGVKGQDGA
jgi:hypothetical protein